MLNTVKESLNVFRIVCNNSNTCLLGDALDAKLLNQIYLKRIREEGGSVSSRIVKAAARGILLAYDKGKLAEFGGHISLSKEWAHSVLHRINFVQRK